MKTPEILVKELCEIHSRILPHYDFHDRGRDMYMEFNKSDLSRWADTVLEAALYVDRHKKQEVTDSIKSEAIEEHIYQRYQKLFDRGQEHGGFEGDLPNLIRELTNAMRDAINWRSETRLAFTLSYKELDTLRKRLETPVGYRHRWRAGDFAIQTRWHYTDEPLPKDAPERGYESFEEKPLYE